MSSDEGHDRYVQPRNREGFRKVVCMGSPDGKEIWLALLLGGKGAEIWVEAIHFESGVRPAGQVRRVVSAEGDETKLLLNACMIFYPDLFRGSCSISALVDVVEQLGTEVHLEKEAQLSSMLEVLQSEAKSMGGFERFGLWEGELSPRKHEKKEKR
ncbi:hypothetical protein EBX31_14230 [bacterium]|nr:hypothetical protein [bacterium]